MLISLIIENKNIMKILIAACLVAIVGFLAFDQYQAYTYKKRVATSFWKSKCETDYIKKYDFLDNVEKVAVDHCQNMVDKYIK